MKKKLLITLVIVFGLFVILFIIQTIDEKINGDDYRKIKEYTQEIASYYISSYCYQNIMEVLNIHEKAADDFDIIKRDIQSCQELQEKIIKTPLPKLHLEQKQEIIELFRNDLINIAELGENYYYSYVNKTDLNEIDLITEQAKYINRISIIHLLELKSRYSVRDILLVKPLLLFTKIIIIK